MAQDAEQILFGPVQSAFKDMNAASLRQADRVRAPLQRLYRQAVEAGGLLPIYRSVKLSRPEDLDVGDIGRYWADNFDCAQPYAGYDEDYDAEEEEADSDTTEKSEYILSAQVPVDSVDWVGTVGQRVNYGEEECEIFIRGKQTVLLMSVTPKGGRPIAFTPGSKART